METSSVELDCMTGRHGIRPLMRLMDFSSIFQGSFCPRFMRASVPQDKSKSMNQNDLDKKDNGMTQQNR